MQVRSIHCMCAAALVVALPVAAQSQQGQSIPAPAGVVERAAQRDHLQPAPDVQREQSRQSARVWQHGRSIALPQTQSPVVRHDEKRWSYDREGRWVMGGQAPGGWNAYKRLQRGARLNHYWRSPDFWVTDFLSFGLAAPPHGYRWVRYYDDAILVDDAGTVWDSVIGVQWQHEGQGYAHRYSYVQAPPPGLLVHVQPVVPNGHVGAYPYGYGGSGYATGWYVTPVITTTVVEEYYEVDAAASAVTSYRTDGAKAQRPAYRANAAKPRRVARKAAVKAKPKAVAECCVCVRICR